MVSAQPSKPLLNVWLLNRHEQQPEKITTPGPLTALTATPSGKYLVGACQEKVYVWQTCTGRLLRVLKGHYQKVTCVRFTGDGSHFVTGGDDGNLLVWNLLEVVAKRRIPGQERSRVNDPLPVRSFADHKLPVTDLHVTRHGTRSRVFTASLDKTAKVYDLATGDLLLDLTFAKAVTSVTVDLAEVNLFLGCQNGDIHVFSLLDPPRSLKVMEEESKENTMKGHTGAVTSLSVSMDGLTLASGSDDETVRLWHVESRQSVRTIGHKGKVTSTQFIVPVKGMLEPERFRQNLHLASLQKSLDSEADTRPGGRLEVIVRERGQPMVEISLPDCELTLGGSANGVCDSSSDLGAEGFGNEEVKKLKRINLELYQHMVNKVLKK